MKDGKKQAYTNRRRLVFLFNKHFEARSDDREAGADNHGQDYGLRPERTSASSAGLARPRKIVGGKAQQRYSPPQLPPATKKKENAKGQ